VLESLKNTERKEGKSAKNHRLTRRSAGAFSRAPHSNRYHLDLTCNDTSPPVRRTARPRSVSGSLQSLSNPHRVLTCPIGTSSASRRFASGIVPRCAGSARLAEREPDSASATGRRCRSIPRETSKGSAERHQQSGVGRSAQRRRAVSTISAGNVRRPTIDSPTGGAAPFDLPRLDDGRSKQSDSHAAEAWLNNNGGHVHSGR
jgi:hypothetical protein